MNLELEQIYQSDGKIDIIKVIKIVWNKWLFILVFSCFFSIGSILYALSLDPVYKSEALLAPDTDQSAGMSSLVSSFGGLAGIVGGGNTQGTTDNARLALPVFKSRDFLYQFIEKRNLLIPLLAAESWDVENGTFTINPQRYNEQTNQWIDENGNVTSEVSAYDAYSKILSSLTVTEDRFTRLVKVEMLHPTPQKAKEWLEWVIEDLNEYFREADRKEAEEAIAYLQEKMSKNNLSNLDKMFAALVESQTKTLMMVNSKKGYVYRTLDKAYEPKQRVSPRRTLIVVAISGIGGLITVFLVLIVYFLGYGFSFSVFPPKLSFHKIPDIS
tara:strand:+ start:103 stop:1086 length:984 start_codon:yes stop_codon:yes gene_type:complete